MKIEELYQLYLKCKKVTTDSRNVEKGAMFFALKGEKFNGNIYAENALKDGCSFAIVDEEKYANDNRYILVNDVLQTLQLLGNYHRKRLNLPIIAITGTNGKTTTKELISSVLKKKFNVSYTAGNLNNHIGVPLTLLSMNEETGLGVIEMGANHMFEIKKLCEIAEPNFGIITNIGKAHLEGFGSFENIVRTKSELYDYLGTHSGKAFYNSGNELLNELVTKQAIEAVPYGGPGSRIKGEIISSDQFLSVKVTIKDTDTEIYTKLVGNYNLENVLAAVCVGDYFDIPVKDIREAIENYIPQNNRSQFVKTTKNDIYLDAYNANPSSVELSLKNFVSLRKSNSCVILGDMLELGMDSVDEHKKILKLIGNYLFNTVILVGNVYNSLEVPAGMLQFENVNELKKWFAKNSIDNSNILIKGSRGIQLETIVEYL